MTLQETLKRAEGVRYKGYQDHRGIWTIGCGHNCQNGPPLSPKVVAMILDDDIRFVRIEITRRAIWLLELEPRRLDVMIELGFWLGINGLFNFRRMMMAAFNNNWQAAADELRDSAAYRDELTHDRMERLAMAIL